MNTDENCNMANHSHALAFCSVLDRKAFGKLFEEWSILFGNAGNERSLGADLEIRSKMCQRLLVANGVGFYAAVAQILGVARHALACRSAHCEITKADSLHHATYQVASGLKLFAIVRHAPCGPRAANA
jgi:hypothetical protein